MFQITQTPSYTAPVKVDLPTDKGKTRTVEFTAKFKRLTLSQIDALQTGIADGTVTDAGVVDEVLLGWEGVQDEDGSELEFNSHNLALLLDIYPTRPSLVRAYFASLAGAKAKN